MSEALAPWASSEAHSLGRVHPEPAPMYRSEYQRDRDRVIHSTAFRRLVYKTQVFVNHEGDLYRTRLTHSLEVAQIARTVAGALGLNSYLTEAICLAHDLGHTPFGHAGQEALDRCMAEYGGFEHNLQSLRVVDELEEKYAEFQGLNLTFETREGILKHCSLDNARQLGELGARFLNTGQPSLEAQIANIADAIAYNNHDVDDGLRAGLLTVEQLCEVELFAAQHAAVRQSYPDLDGRRLIHEIIRRMINRQVVDLLETSRRLIDEAAPAGIDAVRALAEPLLRFSEAMQQQHQTLKRFLRVNLYQHYRVHRMTVKSQRIVRDLFGAIFDDPRLLPVPHQHNVAVLEQQHGRAGRARAVADYIAGMTDRYAIAEYERVYNPRELT